MTRRLIVAYVTLTVFALALFATPLGITFARREHDRLQFDAERNADMVATMIDDPLEKHAPLPERAIRDTISGTRARVVVVDRKGVVILDTNGSATVGTSLAHANDIEAALKGKRVSGRSELQTDDAVVAYATVPSTAEGVVDGAVRIAYPTATLDERVRDVWIQLGLLCLAVLAAVALVGVLVARGVTRPLRNLEHASDRLGRGDLATRLDDTDGPEELRRVAATFNRMAGQLHDLVESQSQFVANASHQLRTPLTGLRLRLENLEAGADDDEQIAIRADRDRGRAHEPADRRPAPARERPRSRRLGSSRRRRRGRARSGRRLGTTSPASRTSTSCCRRPTRRGRRRSPTRPSRCSTT